MKLWMHHHATFAAISSTRRIIILIIITIFSICISVAPAKAQQKLQLPLPTIGQKVIQLFGLLEKKIFKKHTDSSGATSRTHHGIHIFGKNKKDFASTAVDSAGMPVEDSIVPNVHISTLNKNVHPSVEIFGYHPYWITQSPDTYIKEYLTTIAYFAYQVNPQDGSMTNLDKKSSPSALKNAAGKTVVTIINIGASQNKTFLGNTSAQSKLINSLVELVAQQKLNGVSVDFEEVPHANRTDYTAFIKALATALHQQDKDLQVSIAIPALDPAQIFDVGALAPYVDYFIVMAYDYYWRGSTVAGPNSPLISNTPWPPNMNITSAIAKFIARQAPPAKILLGIPYYGTQWQTKALNYPSDQLSYSSLTYYQVKQLLGTNQSSFDNESLTEYYTYSKDGKDYQVWFDGPKSLAEKYQFVIRNHLGGIAIWCLGYDRNSKELWQTLVDNFDTTQVETIRVQSPADTMMLAAISTAAASHDSTLMAAVPVTDSTAISNLPSGNILKLIGVTGAKQMALAGLLVLGSFFLLGFVVAMANKKLETLLKDKLAAVHIVFALLLIGAIILLLTTTGITNGWQMFGFGAAAGLLIGSIIKIAVKSKRDLP
jgi:spore germination protein YaaH